MNPYESPNSEMDGKPKRRVHNIWAINLADLIIMGLIVMVIVVLLVLDLNF